MKKLILVAWAALMAGCASQTTEYENVQGQQTKYVAPQEKSAVSGIGMETNDITAMTDRMMRDMLTDSTLGIMQHAQPPRILLEPNSFTNESSSRINKRMLSDRLRILLNRAAKGKIVFVTQENADRVERARQLKREGVTDAGTIRKTQATFGWDYEMRGFIISQDMLDPNTGISQRSHMITFELIDVESGSFAWSNMYEFAKSGQDSVIYR
jgi:PBP1b-binding outer membrane lipoprotein LpoB